MTEILAGIFSVFYLLLFDASILVDQRPVPLHSVPVSGVQR